jgi:hypothetical protein
MRMSLLRGLREQPLACTMTAMKLSRDPLIHPTAVVIRPRVPTEIAARPKAIAWWERNHARLNAALGDARHLAIEAFLDRYEPGFESA